MEDVFYLKNPSNKAGMIKKIILESINGNSKGEFLKN